jgi:photosystem II stability/assembly factor-like uncharacterized protein
MRTSAIASIHAVLTAVLLLPAGGNEMQAGWVRRPSGTNVRLTDIRTIDSMTAIAVGYARTILKTTDAGDTWVRKSSVGFNLNAVAFRNPAAGIAVGDNRMALFTTDGGETWTQRPIGGSGHFLSVAMVDDGAIFIGNDAGTLHISTDAGVTWYDTSLGATPLYRLMFVRGVLEVTYTGFAVTSRMVYKTTDLGVSWTASDIPLTFAGSALRGACAPGGTCYVVGYDGGALPYSRLIRRGPLDSVWTTFQFPQPSPAVVVRAVSAPSALVAYACGSGGLIFRTMDGGMSWATTSSGFTARLNGIDFFDDDRGLAVGDTGTILFTSAGTTGIAEPPPETPAAAALLAAYPNPFNGETTVAFVLPPGSGTGRRTSLRLYDLAGREVATLVDEVKPPGAHTIRFQAGGLASGIYLLHLRSGSSGVTRKILLLR